MQQTYLPNPNIPYYGGYCEGYVEGTAGQATLPFQNSQGAWTTSGVWNNAVHPINSWETGAWDVNYNGGNHPGELPPGLRVPVFFELGSTPAGHVALSLEDGRVASSSYAGYHTAPLIYPNLQALINDYAKYNNGCTYLGWSEYIGRQQVVKENSVELIEDAPNWRARVSREFMAHWGRTFTEEEFQGMVGRTMLNLAEILGDNPETDNQISRASTGRQAIDENWQGQINSLQAQLKAAEDALAVEQAKDTINQNNIVILQANVDSLTIQLAKAKEVLPPVPDPVVKQPSWSKIWEAISKLFKKG